MVNVYHFEAIANTDEDEKWMKITSVQFNSSIYVKSFIRIITMAGKTGVRVKAVASSANWIFFHIYYIRKWFVDHWQLLNIWRLIRMESIEAIINSGANIGTNNEKKAIQIHQRFPFYGIYMYYNHNFFSVVFFLSSRRHGLWLKCSYCGIVRFAFVPLVSLFIALLYFHDITLYFDSIFFEEKL